MDLLGAAGMPARLEVAGSQLRLPELIVGQLYRVQVTQLMGDKVEILLGNQYLLAATPFRFQAGDVLTLKLIARTADLLTFQVALPRDGSEEQALNLSTLLRAAGLADTPGHRSALAALLRTGVSVTSQAITEFEMLSRNLPPEVLAAFLPFYKELLEKEIRLSLPVLHELARLAVKSPETAGLLSASVAEMERERVAGRRRRRKLDDAVAATLTTVNQDQDLPTAEVLKQQLALLYGSPEKALAIALTQLSGEQADEAEPGTVPIELVDLANLVFGEDVPEELAAALNLLQAQRVRSQLDRGGLGLSLPLVLDGEPTEVHLSLAELGQQYYQSDYSLRIRVANQTQGTVEIHLRTRGPGLSIAVSAAEEEVVPCYQAELPRLSEEIAALGSFIVKRAEVGRQRL